MPITDLIKGHETAVISGSFALLGVFLTLVVTSIQKCIDNLHSLKIKRLELVIEIEKQHLLEPVIEYIEQDLSAMQEVYNLIFVDHQDRSKVKINNTHLSQLSAIQSRIRGLGDFALNNNFSDFSRKRIKIGNAVDHRDKDPYEELQEAIDLAGKIMNSLFDKLKNIKSW